MSEIHFINAGVGDAICLRHASGRTSMIDVCGANSTRQSRFWRNLEQARSAARKNYQMCRHPVNPLDYLSDINVTTLFRFIATHPDMDHLDGLDVLCNELRVSNFWYSGVEREKPDFEGSPYSEEDWDRYSELCNGEKADTTSLTKLEGARFKYANRGDSNGGGDGLYILSPDRELVEHAEETEDFNDASYVILYRSLGGRALFPGDAHDLTWQFVLEKHSQDVAAVKLLVAPHHGRRSGRSYEFLDAIRPTLTLFGCAPSSDLAYDAWRRRKLPYITTNQAGCVAVECIDDKMDVYVENEAFATALLGTEPPKNDQGFSLLFTI